MDEIDTDTDIGIDIGIDSDGDVDVDSGIDGEIDQLTVAELVILLDRSLDPDLPVPVLMRAEQRLAELDPRVMPARPGPPVAVAEAVARAVRVAGAVRDTEEVS